MRLKNILINKNKLGSPQYHIPHHDVLDPAVQRQPSIKAASKALTAGGGATETVHHKLEVVPEGEKPACFPATSFNLLPVI